MDSSPAGVGVMPEKILTMALYLTFISVVHHIYHGTQN